MKKLIYILTFLLSGVAFGQKVIGNEVDSTFIKFKEKVFLLDEFDIDPIDPTETIKVVNKNGVVEKYKKKYIQIIRDTLNEAFEYKLRDDRYTDKCVKFGTDFIVISFKYPHISRKAIEPYDIEVVEIHFYEIIRKEVKVKIKRYPFNSKKDYENIIEIEDLGNKLKNNVEVIIDMFRYPRDTFYIYDSLFIIPEQICCSACNQPRALKPEYTKIYKNEKGNIIRISGCGTDETKISFKYNSSDKLKEIKTKEHIYKIKWL